MKSNPIQHQRKERLGPDDKQVCRKCGMEKKCQGNFSPAPNSSSSGWQWWCNVCIKLQARHRAGKAKFAETVLVEIKAELRLAITDTKRITLLIEQWENYF